MNDRFFHNELLAGQGPVFERPGENRRPQALANYVSHPIFPAKAPSQTLFSAVFSASFFSARAVGSPDSSPDFSSTNLAPARFVLKKSRLESGDPTVLMLDVAYRDP